jgi:hypothetical protein
MRIEYNDVFRHFLLTTDNRKRKFPVEKWLWIEKKIAGIGTIYHSKLDALDSIPKHV